MELQGKSKVPSNFMVLPNRESVNGEEFDTSRLLEKVLERNNMLGLANVIEKLQKLDQWVRRRLRVCIWKQWQKISTKQRNLVRLRISKYLDPLGFVTLTQTYQMKH